MRALRWLILSILLASCSGANGGAIPAQTAGAPFTVEPSTSTPLPPIVTPVATASPLPSPTATFTVEPTATEIVTARALPDPAGYTWQPVVTGLRSPVDLTHSGDGTGRLFIVEQQGLIRIVQDGVLSAEPFLDIVGRITSEGNEQGLLGLAFHPNYARNGYFYVNYTRTDGDTVISRFQVSADNPNRADSDSELQMMLIPQPYANHNGGRVVFGPDGYLYLALGDGGAAGDPLNNAQSLNTLLGKILRVNVDNGEPYTIPPDNPFVSGGGLPEIWAFGLRNPWRIAFDRVSGDLFIADVGQNQWEEVNFLPAGAAGGVNFGWVFFEGTHPYSGALPAGMTVVGPVVEYSHAEGGCSVTGGAVYRGAQLPEWNGVYLYGDYCSGLVWGLLRVSGGWESRVLFHDMGRISSFGEDESGELYLLDRMGTVYRLAEK